MDPRESMLRDTGQDDRVNPRVVGSVALLLGGLDPIKQCFHLRLYVEPRGRMVMHDDTIVSQVSHLDVFPPEGACLPMPTAHTLHQEVLQTTKICLRDDSVALVTKAAHCVQCAQVVIELALGVTEFASGQLGAQRERFLERQRASLDLETGQGLPHIGSAADLGNPLGSQAHGLQETSGLFDRLELPEHARGQIERRREPHTSLSVGERLRRE
jgi:hypothetical protein